MTLLFISSAAIYIGKKTDAVSIAKNLKSGVLIADDINLAFENVGGKVIKKQVIESQYVEKGDVLMVLDDRDMSLTLNKMNAVLDAQKSLIRQEELAIKIDQSELTLLEFSTWRKIEELQALIDASLSTEQTLQTAFDRSLKLKNKGSISQSEYDNAHNSLVNAKMQVIQQKSQLASMIRGATEAQIDKLKREKSAEGMTLETINHAKEKIENRFNQLALLKAQLVQYEAEYEQAMLNMKRLTLVSPEKGKILKVLYEEGELVAPNALVIILETDKKYLDIYVNEDQVTRYSPGASISVYFPALKKESLGSVRFAQMAPSFSDLRMSREHGQADLTSYQVRIYFNDSIELLTGMTGEVEHE